jgi:hypothetical protein
VALSSVAAGLPDDQALEAGEFEDTAHVILRGTKTEIAAGGPQPFARRSEDAEPRRVHERNAEQVDDNVAVEDIEAVSELGDGAEIDFAGEDHDGGRCRVRDPDVELWELGRHSGADVITVGTVNFEHASLLRRN